MVWLYLLVTLSCSLLLHKCLFQSLCTLCPAEECTFDLLTTSLASSYATLPCIHCRFRFICDLLEDSVVSGAVNGPFLPFLAFLFLVRFSGIYIQVLAQSPSMISCYGLHELWPVLAPFNLLHSFFPVLPFHQTTSSSLLMVSVDIPHKPLCLQVFMKASKTDLIHQGALIITGCGCSPVCTVQPVVSCLSCIQATTVDPSSSVTMALLWNTLGHKDWPF